MNRLSLVATLLILPGVGLLGCGGNDTPAPEPLNTEFEAEGILDFLRPDSTIITRIAIEFAETDQEQAQGLMHRRSLPDRGGMLFIDAVESMQSFWMRNTPIPLDILFVDADGEVVNIVKRTTPLSEEQIRSIAPAQYVVEVRGGFTDRYDIDSTASIRWERREMVAEQ